MKQFSLLILLNSTLFLTCNLHTMPSAMGDDEESSTEEQFEDSSEETASDMTSNEPEYESKQLAGPDILSLDTTESLVKNDNPEIVRLADEAESKCTEMEQSLESAIQIKEQADATLKEASLQLDQFYQEVNKAAGIAQEFSQIEKVTAQ